MFRRKKVEFVDKHVNSGNLSVKFEVFLKKVYYMIHGEEMKNTRIKTNMPTFADCISSFECLRDLKTSPIARYQKFSTYLEDVRTWRNNESHESHDTSVEDVDLAIRKATAMYLFVVAKNIVQL